MLTLLLLRRLFIPWLMSLTTSAATRQALHLHAMLSERRHVIYLLNPPPYMELSLHCTATMMVTRLPVVCGCQQQPHTEATAAAAAGLG